MKTVLRAATLAAICGTALSLSPSLALPAQAVGYQINTNAIGGGQGYIRSGTSTSTPGRLVPNYTSIDIVCQTPGTRLGWSSYANNATWDLIRSGDSYRWVHDVITTTPGNGGRQYLPDGTYFTPSVGLPRCTTDQINGTTPRPRDVAVAAALATNGKTYAYETGDATGYLGWAPGPESEWSGDCLYFVRYMYQRAGIDIDGGVNYANARQSYLAHERAGHITLGSAAPRGSVVFWPNAACDSAGNCAGHIAVSLGDGTVITTQGIDGARRPNAVLPISHFGAPAGWMLPAGA